MKHYYRRKNEVWQKGMPILGKDPGLYRLDKFGNEMYYHSYGMNTPMGWQIDHSKPTSRGGTSHLNNLQPMNSKANRQKSDKYPYTNPSINGKTESSFPWGAVFFGLVGAFLLQR